MIDYQTARKIAEAEIDKFNRRGKIVVQIVEDEIFETPHAWVFCWTSTVYLQTGDMDYALGGNAPFFISKIDGAIDQFYTSYSIETCIEMYEKRFDVWSLYISEMDWRSVPKMSALKKVLGWLQTELVEFRANPIEAIGNGTQAEMRALQNSLAVYGIGTLLVDVLASNEK